MHLVDADCGRLAAGQEELAALGHVTKHASALATPAAFREAIASAGSVVDTFVHMAGVFEPDPLDSHDRGVWERAIVSNLTNAYDMAIAFRCQLPDAIHG